MSAAACQRSACKAAHAQHGLNGPQHGIALPQVLHDHHRDAHHHRRDLHKVHQRHDARQPQQFRPTVIQISKALPQVCRKIRFSLRAWLRPVAGDADLPLQQSGSGKAGPTQRQQGPQPHHTQQRTAQQGPQQLIQRIDQLDHRIALHKAVSRQQQRQAGPHHRLIQPLQRIKRTECRRCPQNYRQVVGGGCSTQCKPGGSKVQHHHEPRLATAVSQNASGQCPSQRWKQCQRSRRTVHRRRTGLSQQDQRQHEPQRRIAEQRNDLPQYHLYKWSNRIVLSFPFTDRRSVKLSEKGGAFSADSFSVISPGTVLPAEGPVPP